MLILTLNILHWLYSEEGWGLAGYGSLLGFIAAVLLVAVAMLGGFFLAEGSAKFSLDRNIARVMLRPFGTSWKAIMLGLMVITAGLSMFMSNTATTATLMAVVLPVLATLDKADRLRIGMALAIPLLLLFLFGYALTLDVRDIRTAVYDRDRTSISRDYLSRFTQSGYFRITHLPDTIYYH